MITKMDKNKKGLLDSLMTAFWKRVDTLEARVTQLEEENGELKKRLENTDPNVKSVIGIQGARIAELEQYSRRTNIKIFGVLETANNGGKKNTVDIVKNIFEIRLQQTITTTDILAAHRIPTRNKTQPRPIIVKFLRSEAQESVLRSGWKLKGEPISISDDLCVAMQNMLFKWPDCNMFPSDQPHDNSFITIVYLLNTSVTIYRFPNILVFAQILICCCQNSKCCIPLHLKVTKDKNIKSNNIFVLFIYMFHCNTAPQGCVLYVKRLLYAVMPRPLKLSLYCTHCNIPPPPKYFVIMESNEMLTEFVGIAKNSLHNIIESESDNYGIIQPSWYLDITALIPTLQKKKGNFSILSLNKESLNAINWKYLLVV